METFIEFFTFAYPNIKYVVFGSILLSVSGSVVGCFTFIKKKALVGDVVSHAVLPGICISFILSGTKDPFLLILGAFVSGWLSILVMDAIVQKSKLKEDTATGIALSVFFGVGILLMTYIQHSGNAAQSGLDSFLFGKAAALVGKDLMAFSLVAVLVLVVVFSFYKEFKLISFDPEFARAQGLPVKRYEFILTSVTVLAVVTGIQAVGVVLMAAMLITPAAAARFWSHRLSRMLMLSALFAAFSGIAGAYVSYAVPAMPTGPWIVMFLSLIALVSIFFAPKRGILTRMVARTRIQNQLLEENLLKTFYKLSEKSTERSFNSQDIQNERGYSNDQMDSGLKKLVAFGYIKSAGENMWELLPEGFEKGKRVVRLHRLWELYLTQYLRIAPDHVHEDADTVEHVITPELEAELEKMLDYPTHDPHASEIPKSGV
jgi:manganese/zinc/iron transport system permease protein